MQTASKHEDTYFAQQMQAHYRKRNNNIPTQIKLVKNVLHMKQITRKSKTITCTTLLLLRNLAISKNLMLNKYAIIRHLKMHETK